MSAEEAKQPKVPIHWAGWFRDGVFTCGACPDRDLCVEKGVCQRARPEDFRREMPWLDTDR